MDCWFSVRLKKVSFPILATNIKCPAKAERIAEEARKKHLKVVIWKERLWVD